VQPRIPIKKLISSERPIFGQRHSTVKGSFTPLRSCQLSLWPKFALDITLQISSLFWGRLGISLVNHFNGVSKKWYLGSLLRSFCFANFYYKGLFRFGHGTWEMNDPAMASIVCWGKSFFGQTRSSAWLFFRLLTPKLMKGHFVEVSGTVKNIFRVMLLVHSFPKFLLHVKKFCWAQGMLYVHANESCSSPFFRSVTIRYLKHFTCRFIKCSWPEKTVFRFSSHV